MIIAGCKDHGGPESSCRLDLRRLRARMCEVAEERASLQRTVAHLRTRVAATNCGYNAWYALRADLNAHQGVLDRIKKEQRLLYATRAHHRGHVHEIAHARYQAHRELRVETLPGGQRIFHCFEKQMLPLQEPEIASTWKKFSTDG